MSPTDTLAAPTPPADYYLGIYDFLHEFLVEDVAFYRSLLRPGEDSVLELGCGTGRVLLPLVEAGVDVVGLDINAESLRLAEAKLRDRRWPGAWQLVAADMRDYELPRRFSTVIVPFNTFLFLHSPEDRDRCLRTARRHLLPGGRLVLDVFNPAWVLASRRPGAVYQELVKHRPETGTTLFYFSNFVAANALFYWHQIFDEVDASHVCHRRYRLMKLAHLPEAALRAAIDAAGFTVESAFGWYDRRPLSDEANSLLFVLRTPEA